MARLWDRADPVQEKTSRPGSWPRRPGGGRAGAVPPEPGPEAARRQGPRSPTPASRARSARGHPRIPDGATDRGRRELGRVIRFRRTHRHGRQLEEGEHLALERLLAAEQDAGLSVHDQLDAVAGGRAQARPGPHGTVPRHGRHRDRLAAAGGDRAPTSRMNRASRPAGRNRAGTGSPGLFSKTRGGSGAASGGRSFQACSPSDPSPWLPWSPRTPGGTAGRPRSAGPRATGDRRPARRPAPALRPACREIRGGPHSAASTPPGPRFPGGGPGHRPVRSAPRRTGTGGSSRPGGATRLLLAGRRCGTIRGESVAGGGNANPFGEIMPCARLGTRTACGDAQGAGLALAGPLRDA